MLQIPPVPLFDSIPMHELVVKRRESRAQGTTRRTPGGAAALAGLAASRQGLSMGDLCSGRKLQSIPRVSALAFRCVCCLKLQAQQTKNARPEAVAAELPGRRLARAHLNQLPAWLS